MPLYWLLRDEKRRTQCIRVRSKNGEVRISGGPTMGHDPLGIDAAQVSRGERQNVNDLGSGYIRFLAL